MQQIDVGKLMHRHNVTRIHVCAGMAKAPAEFERIWHL